MVVNYQSSSTFNPFKMTSFAVNVVDTERAFASKTISALIPSMISRVMVVLCVKDDALVLTHVSDFAPSAVVTVILSTNFKSFVRTLEMDLPISEKYVAIIITTSSSSRGVKVPRVQRCFFSTRASLALCGQRLSGKRMGKFEC